MKKILIILILSLLGIMCMSQIVPDTCFTQKQLINIANKVQVLQQKDSINEEIIKEQRYQLFKYEFLHEQDSILHIYKDQKINLLESNIEYYKDLYKIDKKRWYDSKVLWFFLGAGTIITSSIVVENVVGN